MAKKRIKPEKTRPIADVKGERLREPQSEIAPDPDLRGHSPANAASRLGLWLTLAVAFGYCVWLGAHWLPLGYSEKELAAFVSRVWDVQRELKAHGHLTWWTPFYMSGSSYGLNHSQGLYLLPSLVLAQFFPLIIAVKLTALLAIFAGAMAMFFCARHFLKDQWAAALASLAFLFHPEQIIRAAGAEHIGVIVFFPFMPLTFLCFARALDSRRLRDIIWCGLAAVGMLWAHNKMAFVHGVFLACYLAYWLWPAARRQHWRSALRTCALIGLVTAAVGAPIVLPGVIESRYVKLLSGEHEQLLGWQRGFAFKSLLPLVDRDGAATRAAIQGVQTFLQEQRYHPTSREEESRLRAQIMRVFSLGADAPEKYAGLVAMALLAVTALFNVRRVNRSLFWFFIALLMLSVMLASGMSTVWVANWLTWQALFGLPGVPSGTQVAAILALAAAVAFLVLFARRKLTSPRKCAIAGVGLAAFLLLPAFSILALVPLFKEIRAPFVFYDGPGTFFVALLVGFVVTDVLSAERWRAHLPKIVAGLAALVLLDYWPYGRPVSDNGVPARTLRNLETTYAALAQDPDWVKTYAVSGRYFHLLGPMYGGKPQVYEAFFNWMCPLGTALLVQNGLGSAEMHRPLLNLIGARYLVFDKTDPSNAAAQQFLAGYRQMFPVAQENEDFVVLRNENARPYLSAYGRACQFIGDYRDSAPLALALAGRGWPLVQGATEQPGEFEKVYRDAVDRAPPLTGAAPVTLGNVQLTRERDDRILIAATAPSPCLMVIAESFYPFWRATVDGQPVEVLRVSCGLMGLKLSAGQHVIALRYETPRVYTVGAGVSLLALLACGGVLIRESRHARP